MSATPTKRGKLTEAQKRALTFARDWQGLDDGSIEAGIQTGLWGGAFQKVKSALRSRGLIDGDLGEITDAGRSALTEAGR